MTLLPLMLAAGIAATPPPPAQARVAFDGRNITAVTAQGLANRATRRRVRADDPVRIASIS